MESENISDSMPAESHHRRTESSRPSFPKDQMNEARVNRQRTMETLNVNKSREKRKQRKSLNYVNNENYRKKIEGEFKLLTTAQLRQ